MRKIIEKISNARATIYQDGWGTFLTSLFRYFFGFPCQKYYLYKHTPIERDPADFLPDLPEYDHFVIRTRQELEDLELRGFSFGPVRPSIKVALENEVIIFVVFVQGELAHVGRLALSARARPYVDNRPYKVDFENGEACTGNTWTSPKFRGKGLMKYAYFRRLDFLYKQGILVCRNAVEISNIASHRVHARFKPEIYAEGRYCKLFYKYTFWKEKPVTIDSLSLLSQA